MMEVDSVQEEDMWGGMEVQENIIEQLLDGPHSAPLEKTPSSRRVRFTANSTLAVYASEKSLSTEDGSDDEQEEDEYEEDEDEEEEEEEDEEDEEEGTSSDSDGEGYSDDEVVINDVPVVNDHYKDSLELPFIHASRVSPSSTTTSTSTTTTPTDAPSTDPSHTTTTTDTASSDAPRFSKDTLHVQVEQPSPDPQPTQEAAQRGWAQRRQGIQRYTPKYSPKSSPTSAAGELLPTSNGAEAAGNLNLNSSTSTATPPPPQPQSDNTQQSPLIPKAIRATQELHQELARAKEASVNLTISSAKLEQSISYLKDRIALSRELLSALGYFGSSILGLRLFQSIFLSPSILSASKIHIHTSLVLATALASTLVNQYLSTPRDDSPSYTATVPPLPSPLLSPSTTNEDSLSGALDSEKMDDDNKKSDHEIDKVIAFTWRMTTGMAGITACAVVVRWLVTCCRQS